VARRLPAGLLYVLAGPNDTSLNLWQVSNTGCERQLTHNRRGFGVSDFGASRAGVILSDAPTGLDQLARLGPDGPVLLPDGFVSTVGIDPAGQVVYIRPPTGPGRKNVFQMVVKKSYRSAPHVLYRQKASLIVFEWGPNRHIVTIGAADADEHGPMRLLEIGPKGQVRVVRTGLPNVGNAHWGKKERVPRRAASANEPRSPIHRFACMRYAREDRQPHHRRRVRRRHRQSQRALRPGPRAARRREMARLRREHHRMLGNGYCTRPPEMGCAFESICESCTFFQTSIEFRPTLQAQHDQAAAHDQPGRQKVFSQLLNHIHDNQAS